MPDKVYIVMEYQDTEIFEPLAVFADKDDAENYIESLKWSHCRIVEIPYNP